MRALLDLFGRLAYFGEFYIFVASCFLWQENEAKPFILWFHIRLVELKNRT